MEWVSVSGGEFFMGCNANPPACLSNEQPRHKVVVDDFWMMKGLVTVEQFEAIMGENPSCQRTYGTGFPVECVTWEQASVFCEAIGARLPTEAEWEYAASEGGQIDMKTGIANAVHGQFCFPSSVKYPKNKSSGSNNRSTNSLGLHVSGYNWSNIWEWTADWYDKGYYSARQLRNPKGPATGEDHTIRGFGYKRCSLNEEYLLMPPEAKPEVGFRCVKSAQQ